MPSETDSKLLFSPLKNHFIRLLIFVFVGWAIVFWHGLKTAFDIWLISDIFNHCLFVLPGSAYLIYLKRKELSTIQVVTNWWPLLFCIGCLLLYTVGLAGDIQLFMHVATFSFLPFAIWACVGNQFALKIIFPLFFILFCIPIGEELIPSLQAITADIAVVLLQWSNIPIFRTGLYIEIPLGRFLVAEACSGISFFIASIVIGALYSYLNIRSTTRRLLYLGISILVPVFANAVRVYGIIVIAYFSDMEYAVGADHLIYGWFFFAFVIICLLGIGELIREKQNSFNSNSNVQITSRNFEAQSRPKLVACFSLLFVTFFVWSSFIDNKQNFRGVSQAINSVALSTLSVAKKESLWSPKFEGATDVYQSNIEVEGQLINVYAALYTAGQGELISSLNRFYDEKEWSLDSESTFKIGQELDTELDILVNTFGYRMVTFWYVIDGQVFSDKKRAKLYETYKAMLGSHKWSGIVIVSQATDAAKLESDLPLFEQNVSSTFTLVNTLFDSK